MRDITVTRITLKIATKILYLVAPFKIYIIQSYLTL